MDVQEGTRHEEMPNHAPRRMGKRWSSPKPTLEPEAQKEFRQLMARLTSADLDLRCRTIVRVIQVCQPPVKNLILQEILHKLHSQSAKVREAASTLAVVLGPHLIGFPVALPGSKLSPG